MSIRVLVVDDHAIVRDGLRALLASLGMTVVATAADGAAAISAVTEHGPQVVLMDIQMPGMDGWRPRVASLSPTPTWPS